MTAFQRRYYAGGGVTTTLSAAMASTDTTFSITADTGWPGSVGTDFFVVIDRGTASEEKILCSSNTGTTVTVANRGQDGTSAVAHSNAATVSLCITALDGDEANQVTHLLGNATEGALVYGKGAGNLPATLAVGTNGYLLSSNGTDPAWIAPGTINTYTEGSVLYGKGTGNAVAGLAIGTSGQVLSSNGTDPTWTTAPAVAGYTEGSILYGKGSGTTPTALAVGTSTQVLGSNGTDPVWVNGNILNGVASNSLTGVNLTSGSWVNVASLVIPSAGTWLINAKCSYSFAASFAENQAQAVVSTTSASTTGTVAYGFLLMPAFSAGAESDLHCTALVTLTATTYYFNVLAGAASAQAGYNYFSAVRVL